MRKVIDNNAFQTPELAQYLAASQHNHAVLTNYGSVEAYRGNPLKNIFRSMAVLAQYPNQVLVLKGTQTLCGLHGRGKGLQKRLVDWDASKGFPDFCRDLKKAAAGDTRLQAGIKRLGRDATNLASTILASVPKVKAGFQSIAETYSDAEIRCLRSSAPISPDLMQRFVSNVILFAGSTMDSHPKVTQRPATFELLMNTYLFRYSLVVQLWLLEWIEQGSNANVRDEKIQHDLFDLQIITCATYFDGLMTADIKARRIYTVARWHLDSMKE